MIVPASPSRRPEANASISATGEPATGSDVRPVVSGGGAQPVLSAQVIGVSRDGEIVACGALKEYSPSVAEVAAIAVSRTVHGCGGGKAIVRAVEALAIKRGIYDVFALTLQPAFFGAIGYQRVDRARYPEKIRRDCIGCARRFACNETCFARLLREAEGEPMDAGG